jgi:lipopolysaccharide export system permease protein
VIGWATVTRWLGWRFLKSYLILSISIAMTFVVIDAFVKVERFSGEGGLLLAAKRYGRMLPELFYVLSPFLILLSALWVLAELMRSNELVALSAAGYSPAQVAFPLLAFAFALAPIDWADRELLLPALSELRRDHSLRDRYFYPRPVPDVDGGVLSGLRYYPKEGRLERPRYVRLTPEGQEEWTIVAGNATYSAAVGWVFVDGYTIRQESGVDRIEPIPPSGTILTSGISLSDVEAAIDSPAYLSSDELQEQIRRTPGFKHLAVQYYERYTQPLAGVVLLLLSIPVVLGGEGGVGTILRFLSIMGMAIAYFVLNMLCTELGSRGALSPLIAAALPLVVCGGLGFVLIRRTQ